ncbi:MAG TPA: nucleotidyltransferase family protein [Candidatus Manganitrophaceae bacterium]|nr:nucleotidyltransferase family protein [Candidatus Manganitrophaceae bacterium]
MNAFVLAGDRGERRQVGGMNKALLTLEGRPLIIHVLSALDQARGVDRIYVIGPQKEIMGAIEQALPYVLFTKKIEVLPQKENLVENILSAYASSLPGYRKGSDPRQLPNADEPGLFLPADIPLVTAAEIDAFISACDMEKYDYCLGVTSESALRPFYPSKGRPGIKMPYLYLKDQVYRMNNLHLARPYRIGMADAVQEMYDHRHQRYTGNRFRIAYRILKSPHGPSGLVFYLLAQGGVFFMNAGLPSIASFFRKRLPAEAVEKEASTFLQTRFKAVETRIGGAALDVDDEKAYRAISHRFREWKRYLAGFDEKSDGPLCPGDGAVCGRYSETTREASEKRQSNKLA